jgi:hypothetical protein
VEYNRDQYIKDFIDETQEMLNLTTRKNHDYGGDTDPFKNFRDFGELGILVRMSDKFARIRTALQERRDLKVSDETIEDTIRDLAVYTIILQVYRKANKDKQNELRK